MSLERLFVLDTNIIVSAVLIKESRARQALDKAQGTGIVLISTPVLSELEEVLARPKFDKYVTRVERKLFLAGFVKTVKFVEVGIKD
jgi:putative PIN family toxin of toxin-antitoxin system